MQDIREIPIGEIYQAKSNIRKASNEKNLQDLVQSVKSKGILQPIIVRIGKSRGESAYEIVCGHRRVLAAVEAGLKVVPAIVRELSDDEAAEINVIENLQREDVNAMDEAQGIYQLMLTANKDIRAVASKLGKSENYVAGRLKLLSLPAEAQKAIQSGDISPAHGLVVARITNIDDQKKLLKQIRDDKLSVRAAENVLDRYGKELTYAPFSTGACGKCEFNGTKIKDFFDEDTNLKGHCMNKECYSKKVKEWVEQYKSDIEKAGGVVLTEKEADKTFPSGWRYNDHELRKDDKKQLGKKYTEKCLLCPKHAYVLKVNEYHKEEVRIEEYCLNPRCFHATESIGQGTEDKADQSGRNDQRDANKALNRCSSVMRKTWQDFATAQLIPHVVSVLVCKTIKDALMGCPDDDNSISKLWKKTDDQLAKSSQEGLKELITSQYDMKELSELATGLKFDPTKDLTLDDTYFGSCSKSDLLALAKKLGVKDLSDSDKRADMITKVKAAVKPGFVPDDIKKYIKEL